MPRGDRTGPSGIGPMTGRAAGYCAGNGMPGCANSGGGRGGRGYGGGSGQGRGYGRGRRNQFYAADLRDMPEPAPQPAPIAPSPQPVSAASPVPAQTEMAQVLDALKHQADSLKGAFEGIEQQIEELKAKVYEKPTE